jgi:DNA uptake protein ComE-like DNA-binding protein
MHQLPRRSLATAFALVTALAACGGQDEAAQAPESSTPAAAPATETAAPAQPAAPAAGTTATPAAAATGMIDPNSATREQLLTVPGMDAAAADALVAGRPYADMVAVDKVLAPRMGEPQRKAAYARLWKPIDLNKASKEEILLIPGVGPRMQHEFEEYRPYRNIEQFRREIGKYVDPPEVARLEQYVQVR